MKKSVLLSTALIITLISCNTQKMEFRPGYYGDLGAHPNVETTREQVLIKRSPAEALPQKLVTVQVTQPKKTPSADIAFSEKKIALASERQIEKSSNKPAELALSPSGTNPVQIDKAAPPGASDKRESGDGFLYLGAALMAIATLGFYRANRSNLIKLTRWAKANPKKAQLLITGIQLPLLGLGLMSGYNMKELGYDISGNVSYLFGSMMLLGFMAIPFLPKRKTIAIPKQVYQQRLAYLGITISSLMMTVGFGNSIENKYPDTLVAQGIKKMDQSIISMANVNTADRSDQIDHNDRVKKTKAHKRQHKIKNLRMLVAGGSCATAILLIILLIPVLCAGICLMIFGIAGIADSVGVGILLFLGGGLLTFLSIKGMIKLGKWCKTENANNNS